MIQRISFLLKTADTSLKPLGKALFTLYVTLFFLGCVGFLYGIASLICKIAHVGSAVTTPWWEIAMLILASWYTSKTFKNESYNLISKDVLRLQPNKSESLNIVTMTPRADYSAESNHSNVIPFKRRNEVKPH